MFYKLSPEVAGGFGPNTIMDSTSHPPLVTRLHYRFDGWLGDELLEFFASFIVTENLQRLIQRTNPSGCSFEPVETSRSEQFEELFPGRELPPFVWLKVNGKASRDDFGIDANNSLVVSERMLQVLRQGVLSFCDIEEL